jgi:hypothetical protein
VYNYFIDGRESCAAGASALAEYADAVKHQTMIKCTVELRTAVTKHLDTLSGHLLAKGLITTENDDRLRNTYTPEANRAAELVAIIQGKVKQNHQNYDTFVDTLTEADSDYYSDILKTLSKTLHEGNYGTFLQ